jgi:hypothetical protein
MNPNLDLVQALEKSREVFTLTKVSVKVSPELGGYVIDVDGDIAESLRVMNALGEISEILEVAGVIHNPKRTWRYAFRVDRSGVHIANNARDEDLQEVEPELKAALKVAS